MKKLLFTAILALPFFSYSQVPSPTINCFDYSKDKQFHIGDLYFAVKDSIHIDTLYGSIKWYDIYGEFHANPGYRIKYRHVNSHLFYENDSISLVVYVENVSFFYDRFRKTSYRLTLDPNKYYEFIEQSWYQQVKPIE